MLARDEHVAAHPGAIDHSSIGATRLGAICFTSINIRSFGNSDEHVRQTRRL